MAQSFTLVKDGEERTVTTPAARVDLRFNGWVDKTEVKPPTTANQSAPVRTSTPNPALTSGSTDSTKS